VTYIRTIDGIEQVCYSVPLADSRAGMNLTSLPNESFDTELGRYLSRTGATVFIGHNPRSCQPAKNCQRRSIVVVSNLQ